MIPKPKRGAVKIAQWNKKQRTAIATLKNTKRRKGEIKKSFDRRFASNKSRAATGGSPPPGKGGSSRVSIKSTSPFKKVSASQKNDVAALGVNRSQLDAAGKRRYDAALKRYRKSQS